MPKTQVKPKSKRKKNRPSKHDALKAVLKKIQIGDFKFPKKLRKSALRELTKEKNTFHRKLVNYHSRVTNPDAAKDPFKDVAKLPRFKNRLIELFDQDMKPMGFDMPDLMDPKKKIHGSLNKLIWLEGGLVEIPKHDDKPAELKETNRSVSINPNDVSNYFEKGRIELKESGLDTGNFQGQVDVNRSDLAGKYFPYPPSSFTRQLYIPDSWFMLARAAHAYNYNPLAKAGMDIKTSFIVGNGPKIIFGDNPGLDKLWKQFEKDEDFIETLRNWCMMLGVNGELFVEFFRLLKTNVPTVRSIDPGHVYEIITEPRDIRQVYGYKLMYQTQYQTFGTGARGEQVPLSEYVYETIVPDNVMHIKVNVQENEKRGRSDLLSGLAVLQLFEDYIRYKVLRAIVEAAFVWDVKMTGADQQDIDDFLNNEDQAFPQPGSTRAHNENTEWKAETNTAGASGKDDVFEMLLTVFAVSINLPKEYMGASSSGSRANAITSSEPAVKAFQARRRKLESLIMRIIDFLATSNGIAYDPDQVEVTWDEIAPEDINKKIDRLYTEMDRDTLTKKRVDEMIAKLEGVSNYDWLTEMTARLQEKTGGIVKSLEDASPMPMTGNGEEVPEKPNPVVAPPEPVGAGVGAPGAKTAATSPATSGAPSSLSAQDKLDVKTQGKAL